MKRWTIGDFVFYAAVALALLLVWGVVLSRYSHGQDAKVTIVCPPMLVVKIRAGLWQAQKEVSPCVIDFAAVYSPYQKDKLLLPAKHHTLTLKHYSPFDETIPSTLVRKTRQGRFVDACVSDGTDDKGGRLTLYLPAEPVRIQRQGLLRWLPVAQPMTAVGTYTLNGKVWNASVDYSACPTDPVGLGLRRRMARQITATGTLTKRK